MTVKVSVGIDFGTSNSGVAIFDGRQVHLLPLDPENVSPEVVKTVLYLTRDNKTSIGQEAIRKYYEQNINRPRRFVNKWLGEIEYHGSDGMFYVTDVFILVDELTPGRLLQYLKTGLRTENYTGTLVFDRFQDLKTLISIYLAELKRRAEIYLGAEIGAVTLGRPVHFHTDPIKDAASQETLRQAALAAGFDQVQFELEPVAAALFYEQTLQKPENALIFDFGGGTLDITILRLGDPTNRRIFASGGIGIAGADFDRAIIQKRMLEHFGKGVFDDPNLNALIESISDWQTLPQLSTPTMKSRLERAIANSTYPTRLKALEALIFNDLSFQFYNRVEAAKIALSSQGASVISLDAEDIHIWEMLTRLQFEHDIQSEREQIEHVLQDTIARSGLEIDQIDSVIRTGGSSSIPCFQLMLEQIFGKDKVRSSDTFSSVTAGLAIRAYQS
ncbi:MAG TPA: Hsp70 family protein [Anaerolineaceae bacterium]